MLATCQRAKEITRAGNQLTGVSRGLSIWGCGNGREWITAAYRYCPETTKTEIQREGKGQTRTQGRDMKELGDKGNQKVENFGISA
jgi:hypothetical protein